ncbi:sqv-3 [Symbiodinium sp. KB8]|nr:sqv-3 [Symbiodinium sp. KB8]
MGEIVAVRGHYEQTPPRLALQKGSRDRDCGGCSANLGRRLDLLEARVLSHWHEFLVHKSEVQRKFEDVFAACRGHRPKGSMSAHADLERRLSFCEGVVRDSEDERARHLELKVLSEDTWRGLERLQNRVTQESDNLGKVSSDLQRRLAVLDKKSEELQLGLQSQVTDMRKEMQDVIVRASRELGVELRSSFERRIRQGHDEALESAEIASQRCMKSVMSEMNASVMTAEARAQQQCARLRGELEVAEAAAEDIWRRSSNEIARAVAASETSFKPRLQQIDEDARAAMTALELSLERRLLQHSSEAAENLRSLDARAQQNMAEVAESITHVEQLLRSQRSEALASLEALDSRLATQSRRCTDSEAREASLERRLQKDHVQLADDLHTNMLQVRRELADRTGTVESRVIAEVAGLRDELKDSIAAGRDEWAMRLSEAQQQLTRLSGASRSLQDSLAGCQKEVAELRDTQHAMENSVAGLHASRDSELRLLAEDSRAFKAKFTEEILDAQGVSRSLGHRMSTVEAACAGADRPPPQPRHARWRSRFRSWGQSYGCGIRVVAVAAEILWPRLFPKGRTGLGGVVVVVPFRDQLPLQDRRRQLSRFLPHMKEFLAGVPHAIVIVEQSQDGQKFNRGKLLNVGFKIAAEVLPTMEVFITHDVDLLPSRDMLPVYVRPPPESRAIHLASVWQKYTYKNFLGGVLSFRPSDFERINGFPNNYWGWGLEDDQLGLRMAHNGVRTLGVRLGEFEDLDPINMKSILERRDATEVRKHLPWYNANMFQCGELTLDPDWSTNGLRGLDFEQVDSWVDGPVHHKVVMLSRTDPAAGTKRHWSASSARDEVLAMRTSFRSSLDHVEAAKDELSKELETQGRAVRQAVEKAHLDGHQAACEELYKEQRNLRAEVSEQLQRLTSVERRAKDVARGEEASAQRVAALSEQVERLVRAAHSPSDAGHREVFAELQTAVTRMEELQSQVNRLLRDSKKSTEKWETVLPRLQEAERAVERLSRGPTQMHREMQELRSQLAETRLQASLTPRSDRVPVLTRKGPGAPSAAKLFLGVYPRGLQHIAVAELTGREGLRIWKHHEEHCALLFQLPEGPVLELGSFLLLREVPPQCAFDETGLWLPPRPTLHDLARAARAQACSAADFWRSRMRDFKTWRVFIKGSDTKYQKASWCVIPPMACELHHSPGRLKRWVQEHGRRRTPRTTAPERVQEAAAHLDLVVARREAEVAELRVEAQRAKAALEDAQKKEEEEAASQEAAQVALAKDLQVSLHGEKELLERLDAEEEEAKADAALCERADSQRSIALAELRELHGHLQPLQESLAREEAALAALRSELTAGQLRAVGLAQEAAEASRKKQASLDVREPLIHYFAGRAYQDWEESRADGLRNRLVLKRCFRRFQAIGEAASRLCHRAAAFELRRRQQLPKQFLDGWRFVQGDWQVEERLLTQIMRGWAEQRLGATGRRLRALQLRRLASEIWVSWSRLVPKRLPTRLLNVDPVSLQPFQRLNRGSCLGAFRGWSFLTWLHSRQASLAKGFWKRRRATNVARALWQLRASVTQRRCWHRCAPLLWRLFTMHLFCWQRRQPFVGFVVWRGVQRRCKRGRSMALEKLSQCGERESLAWRREVWKRWHDLLAAGYAAVQAAASSLSTRRARHRQRLWFLWLLRCTRLSSSTLRCVAWLRTSRLKSCFQHWCRCIFQARRLCWLSRRMRHRLLQVVVQNWASRRHRHKVPRAAAQVGQAHRRRSLHRTIHLWLLAFERRRLQAVPLLGGTMRAQAHHCFLAELRAARAAETNLAEEEALISKEAVSLRSELVPAAHDVGLASHKAEQAQMELQVQVKALEEFECAEVEQQLCEVLRLNVELARGFRESESCVAAAAMRLDALCSSSASLRKQLDSAEQQYTAAMATLVAEAAWLREKLG